jgi:hypothetical protein
MPKDNFKALFDEAIAKAIENAQQQSGRHIRPDVQIILYGAGHSGDLLSRPDALDVLYLGDDKFYRVIDVAVVAVNSQFTRIVMAASGHPPGSFEQTWNDPPGSGPFKQVISKEIHFLDD